MPDPFTKSTFNREQAAERIAAQLALIVEATAAEFFRKDQLEQFELILARIGNSSELKPIVDEIVQTLGDGGTEEEIKLFWDILLANRFPRLSTFFKEHFQTILYFSVLHVYLEEETSPFGKRQMRNLRESLAMTKGLTPKRFQDGMLEFLRQQLFKPTPRGARSTAWIDERKLMLLSYYNRFLIVIGNARKAMKAHRIELQKAGKGDCERKARQCALKHFEIPARFSVSLFSFRNKSYWENSASDLALEWAVDALNPPSQSRSVMEKALKSSRKLWNEMLSQDPRLQVRMPNPILIDLRLKYGMELYAISRNDSEKKAQLKFSPVPKAESVLNDPNGFLLAFNY